MSMQFVILLKKIEKTKTGTVPLRDDDESFKTKQEEGKLFIAPLEGD